MMKKFNQLAYPSPDSMLFGKSLQPVRCGFDLNIGGGQVYPEINFTLPPMTVDQHNLSAVLAQYDEMVTAILKRLVILAASGAVLEFEHTPQMTDDVAIGRQVTELIKNKMQVCYDQHGLPTALRVTICDVREKERPPRLRTGEPAQLLFEAFRQNARQGADMLAIESTGGKEISDRALMEADLPALLFALGVLAPRDMHFLWHEIVEIARDENVVASGDTACAFANTAMVLADQGYIPNVLAAVVRAMSAVRSLVAYEEGATGPSKDCAYEGPVIKAITGTPISMEGKSAACAHFSHVGNVAAAVCDLWSNESVQNVRLLSGYAPEVFSEILLYDCRLMNRALAEGSETMLQRLLVNSDAYQSVQALVISPGSSFEIARAIVAENSDYQRTRRAGLIACEIIRNAVAGNLLPLPKRELSWLTRIENDLNRCHDEQALIDEVLPNYRDSIALAEYGL